MKIRAPPRRISRNQKGEKGDTEASRSFPRELMEGALDRFRNHDFGVHLVDKIELNVMSGPKAADGYYATLGETLVLNSEEGKT
jgi:hypothetical protein